MDENRTRVRRAVANVNGVVIMVAITVILASLAGSFALGFYDDVFQDPAPQVNWEYEYDEDAEELTIRHEAGDSLDPSQIHVRIHHNGTEKTWTGWPRSTVADDGDVEADSAVTLGFPDEAAAEEGVTVYWRNPDPEPEKAESAVVGRWDGP